MLRNIFVFSIIAFGLVQALRSPFNGLLFYMWLAYFRPESWVWSDAVRSLNISFIAGLLVVAGTALAAPKLRFGARPALLALFVAQAVISTLVSDYQWRAWPALQDFLRIALISYLIVLLVDDEQKLRTTLLVIAYSLGFEAAKQGLVGTLLNPGGKNANPVAFLGDENGVALGMLMLAPLFVALSQTATRHWERRVHQVFLVGTVLRAIATYSRGGFVAAGALALFYILLGQRKLRTLVGLSVIAGIILFVMPPQFWERMNTITATQEERDASAQGRLHYWTVGVVMAFQNPLTGVGYDAFSSAYDTYDPARGEFLTRRAAHSAWFAVLGELGFPGLFLFVSLIVSGLWVCDSLRRRGKRDPQFKAIGIYATALEGSLIAYSAAGTFLSAHTNEMFWHFVGLSIAVATAAGARKSLPVEKVASNPTGGIASSWVPPSAIRPNATGARFTAE